jgi:NAD(P)H-dependent FMN reductase
VTKPNIQIILGSTRQGRAGEQVARWFADIAAARSDLNTEVVDLRDWPLPFFDEPASPKRSLGEDVRIQAWASKVREADGYVLVTPEYNHGYPAVLKNALDHLFYEWNDKPVSFVGYGGAAGGTRAVQQLRQVVIELGLVPIPQQVILPKVYTAFDESGKVTDPNLDRSANAVLDELVPWAELLQARRAAVMAAAN